MPIYCPSCYETTGKLLLKFCFSIIFWIYASHSGNHRAIERGKISVFFLCIRVYFRIFLPADSQMSPILRTWLLNKKTDWTWGHLITSSEFCACAEFRTPVSWVDSLLSHLGMNNGLLYSKKTKMCYEVFGPCSVRFVVLACVSPVKPWVEVISSCFWILAEAVITTIFSVLLSWHLLLWFNKIESLLTSSLFVPIRSPRFPRVLLPNVVRANHPVSKLVTDPTWGVHPYHWNGTCAFHLGRHHFDDWIAVCKNIK